ncbi:hypothetical protein ACFPM3_23640 [Streptomyces coeruleoprunus]|uniref:Uncharacterized protein n=1 Tax=Streptomyces coeruleoprunus TaxID=285563 RepID=A0ABV9XLT4_9ACTN
MSNARSVRPRNLRAVVVTAVAGAVLAAGAVTVPGSPFAISGAASPEASGGQPVTVLAGAAGSAKAKKKAACPEAGQTYYKFGRATTKWLPTNVRSDWARPGLTINYTTSKAGSVTAQMTATASAEAGVIFAKASVSLGVSVGTQWTKTDQWSYQATVPKKVNGKKVKKARLVMFHEAKKFTTTKKVHATAQGGGCTVRTVWKRSFVAPVKKNSNTWGLQYQYK